MTKGVKGDEDGWEGVGDDREEGRGMTCSTGMGVDGGSVA